MADSIVKTLKISGVKLAELLHLPKGTEVVCTNASIIRGYLDVVIVDPADKLSGERVLDEIKNKWVVVKNKGKTRASRAILR